MKSLLASGLLVVIMSLPDSLLGQIPRTLSYQGILADTLGGPKPNGTYGITFRLYNVAGGGSPLWSETKSLQVKRGLFSTALGDQTSFPPSLSFDRQYWLSIQPAGDPELLPRIPLSSVGYSINSIKSDTAQYARTGPVGGSGRFTLPYADSASSPNAIFFMSNQGSGGGIFGHSRISPGVFGGSDSASAVFGVTAGASPTTSGVVGIANASNGFVNGVYGISINSPFGIGTAGWGRRMGVYGVTDTGTGVVGQSNFNIGVSGISSSGTGVRGEATSVASGAYGVYGRSPGLIGVFGEIPSSGTGGIGVLGKNGSNDGTGVRGEATGTSGINYGVYGRSSSPSGYGGYFEGKVSAGVLQITGGSDLAEPFETESEVLLEPGTVMSIDPENPGKLHPCTEAYDSRVAGIVSGAGNVRPGLTLKQDGVMEGNALVAIAGRVYCKAEAFTAAIAPGDLLTTSNLLGHAMKAKDNTKSHGTVLGKAMSSLKEGTGLVLVLVNLQ